MMYFNSLMPTDAVMMPQIVAAIPALSLRSLYFSLGCYTD